MFCGESSHTLDGKNRVHVPKRFRPFLPEDAHNGVSVVVTRGPEGCLWLFPKQGFDAEVGGVETGAFVGREERDFQRQLFGSSEVLQLDAAGRVLLSEKLKRLGGIDTEVVLVGAGTKIEIWARDRWEAYEAAHADDYDRLADALGQRRAAGERNGDA